jgi:hypothetical protein
VIDPADIRNPRNYKCPRCGVAPLGYCKTNLGIPIYHPDKQHLERRKLAENTAFRNADMSHPRSHTCGTCKAPPGEFCQSKNGKRIIQVEKQHAARQKKANEWVYGK